MLWTNEGSRGPHSPKSQPTGILSRVVAAILSALGFVFRAIRRCLAAFVRLLRRSRIALAASVILALALLGGVVDFGMNWGRIYPGIKIGEVDVGGKSTEEAAAQLEAYYGQRLAAAEVNVFANEEAARDPESAFAQSQDEEFAEQHSVEETQRNKVAWKADAAILGARLDTKAMLDEALAYGREQGGVFNRIQALLSGHTVAPSLAFDGFALEAFAKEIDASIGNPRVNFDIRIVEGEAAVTEGHDGMMVDRKGLAQELSNAFLGLEGEKGTSAIGSSANAASTLSASVVGGSDDDSTKTVPFFIAHAEYAPLQITRETAQQTCDRVNASLSQGAQFVHGSLVWTAKARDLGNWVRTQAEEVEGKWVLRAYLDYDSAKGSLLSHLKASFDGNDVRIRFTVENGAPIVSSGSTGVYPLLSEALDSLDAILFKGTAAPQQQPVIQVGSAPVPARIGLEDAINKGVVSRISSFTTEYTSNVENRNHNIHLVADLISNSVIPADGGIWSFNGTAGNCNEEAGFKGAGSIIDGELVDEIGGGICQVATTVFNAVYDAGYPVTQRHNHTLYIASYPEGRDAAVSWPDLDLKWKNDTSSDILMVTSYTDSSITVTLYGISPGYMVSTETGEWQEGEKFKTTTLTDEGLAPGYSYIKTPGENGSRINVVRTVKDPYGNILHEDLFVSSYDPKNEVKIEGPKAGTGAEGED
jgi:vancomycin resistance protein YoaR